MLFITFTILLNLVCNSTSMGIEQDDWKQWRARWCYMWWTWRDVLPPTTTHPIDQCITANWLVNYLTIDPLEPHIRTENNIANIATSVWNIWLGQSWFEFDWASQIPSQIYVQMCVVYFRPLKNKIVVVVLILNNPHCIVLFFAGTYL